MYILALDLGTTGNRAIVFDRRQNVVSRIYREFPQIYPKPGWVEHDPEVIWRSVRQILAKTFRRVSVDRIAALGVTNQRETVLLWDKRTGRPLCNAIVWQCRRTAPLCEALKQKGLEDFIHKRSGLFLDPYFSASKIAWFLENLKGVRKRAERGDVLTGTIDAWIVWKLSGGALHVTDVSNASRTMLLDISRRTWDEKLCGIFRVPPKILPRVVPSIGKAGVTAKGLFGTPIPIAGIAGDQQAAAFAQGCFKPGILKNTYGTGLFMLENIGRAPRFSDNLLTTAAWAEKDLSHADYAVEGSVFVGGAAIGWLRDGLGILKKAADSEKLAQSVPSSGGVYFVPALAGLGAPYWDPGARGTIIGITRGTTRAHLVRAALEAIAYQTRDLLEVMRRDMKKDFKVLRVDGGASGNNFLMQLQADVLGIPVERPRILETTALGAAGMAGIGAGTWRDREEFLSFRKLDRVFRPKARGEEGERFYGRWKEAVRRSRGWELTIDRKKV
ncbi:MAG: glycerol kinase GlpK [Candidatus Omnitrophica bacterium]|nr:glycerol kinase GlpK [Candidatus Omnitrophota bacterium]